MNAACVAAQVCPCTAPADGQPVGCTVTGMERAAAAQYVADNAATGVEPTLTDAEITRCIDRALVVDASGYKPTEDGYTETVWGTQAVLNALELKVAKASALTDVSGDGTSISANQLVANLQRLRGSWRSKLTPLAPPADPYGPYLNGEPYWTWV